MSSRTISWRHVLPGAALLLFVHAAPAQARIHGLTGNARFQIGDGLPLPIGFTAVPNGKVAAKQVVPADEKPHRLTFDVAIDRSSWVALRHYPQLHTNPVNVVVAGKPIRSRQSAQWCAGVIEQLWRARGAGIRAEERDEARKTFEQAIDIYKKIAAEAQAGG